MGHKWRCPKCHRITTNYDLICQYPDCDGTKSAWQYFCHTENPLAGTTIIAIVLGIIILAALITIAVT